MLFPQAQPPLENLDVFLTTALRYLPSNAKRVAQQVDAGRWQPAACLTVCAEMSDDSLVSTVAEIKEAIAHLSPHEYCELVAQLLAPQEDDEWDGR